MHTPTVTLEAEPETPVLPPPAPAASAVAPFLAMAVENLDRSLSQDPASKWHAEAEDASRGSADLPPWLSQSTLNTSTALRDMQALKAKGVKNVRWRSLTSQRASSCFQGIVASVKTQLRDLARSGCEDVTPSAPQEGKAWVDRMWQSSRRSMQDMRDDASKRPATLLLELPSTVWNKFDVAQVTTEDQCTTVLLRLCTHHKGEIVETNARDCKWTLTDGPCPNMPSAADRAVQIMHPQFRCYPRDHQTTQTSCVDFGKQDIRGPSRAENPDWGRQMHRFYVPCTGTTARHWARTTTCTTLGSLFKILGRDYTAAAIYYVYLTMRVVAVKATADVSSLTWRSSIRVAREDQHEAVKEFCEVSSGCLYQPLVVQQPACFKKTLQDTSHGCS